MTDTPTHLFRPNRGAQAKFLKCNERYPAFVGGLGSGKTWAGSARLILHHAHYIGTDSLVVAPTYPNLRQITVPAITARLTEAGIPHKPKLTVPMEIRTPSLGSKILLHSGVNAERIAGFQVGRAWIDEPARCPEYPDDPQRDVWKNTIARVRSPGVPVQSWQVWCTGTHEGRGTWFYRDWEQKPLPGHVLFRGSTFENPDAFEYARNLVEQYGVELAYQYVHGYAVESSMPAIPYQTILGLQDGQARLDPDWPVLERSPYPLFVGMDIGRKQSLTVFWVLGAAGMGLYMTMAVIIMREASFADQADMINRLMSLSRCRRIAIDATYNPQTAETALERWGEFKVEPVTFTRTTKLELCQGLIHLAQSGDIRIPPDEEIVQDWYQVKRMVTPKGDVTFEAPFTADGHSDRFFGATLAVRAALHGGVCGGFEYTAGKALAFAGMRTY